MSSGGLRRQGLWLIGCATLVIAMSGPALAFEEDETRQITVQQAPLLNVTAPASTLGVDVWTNRADGAYGINEDLALFVRTSYDAAVTILNVDAAGRTTMLFPNRFAPDNRLRGNQVYQVPGTGAQFKLHIAGPVGVNLIKVIATTSTAPIFQGRAVEQSGPFDTYADTSEELARQIQVEMTQPQNGVWAIVDRPIRVVSRQAGAQPPQVLQTPISSPAPLPPPIPPSVIVGNSPVAPTPGASPGQPTPGLPGLSGMPSAFGLEVRTAKESYRMGEDLALTLTSERNCKLTLLSVDAQNNAAVLYPNRLEKEPGLRAGQTTFLPGTDGKMKFTLMGQPGPQSVIAICGEEWSLMGSVNNLFRSDDRSIYPSVNNQVDIAQVISAQLKSGRKIAHSSVSFLLVQ
ncbi:DUF4384 domain-containing protein [Bradyrhizobium sp. 21]|uniref:DUF4384 domain-containing protein n=1 Tax=Bradyrhizobium sp. 21 TaxID=2782666 RepID=UPI001FFA7257|nr:DUF4384 domain-containing protein [Bradyrhizobium sp. 21]MCK1389027.1 DUF4384 domain-containing protein [Bradyrhizobium sp. 21]